MRFFAIAFIITTTACGEQKTIENLLVFDSTKYYLILPIHGCKGCLQEAKNFVRANLNNKDIGFIFTGYTIDKDVRLTIGNDLYNSDKVTMDDTNILMESGFDENYPSLVYMDSNKLRIDVLSSELIHEKLQELFKDIGKKID